MARVQVLTETKCETREFPNSLPEDYLSRRKLASYKAGSWEGEGSNPEIAYLGAGLNVCF